MTLYTLEVDSAGNHNNSYKQWYNYLDTSAVDISTVYMIVEIALHRFRDGYSILLTSM